MAIYKHKSQKEVNKTTSFGYGSTPSFKYYSCYGLLRDIKDLIVGQQARAIRAFVKDIEGKGKMLASLQDGLNTMEIINGIYLSSWTGKSVSLPIDDDAYEALLETKKQEEIKRG